MGIGSLKYTVLAHKLCGNRWTSNVLQVWWDQEIKATTRRLWAAAFGWRFTEMTSWYWNWIEFGCSSVFLVLGHGGLICSSHKIWHVVMLIWGVLCLATFELEVYFIFLLSWWKWVIHYQSRASSINWTSKLNYTFSFQGNLTWFLLPSWEIFCILNDYVLLWYSKS